MSILSRTSSLSMKQSDPANGAHISSRKNAVESNPIEIETTSNDTTHEEKKSIQLFPRTPQDGVLWEDFKREMRAVVCRADQYLVEYDASVLAQQEFESQQEQLQAKAKAITVGRAGLLKTYEVRRESLPNIHASFPQMASIVADHAQNMAMLVKLSERFSLAEPLVMPKESPEAKLPAGSHGSSKSPTTSPAKSGEQPPSSEYGEEFFTADALLGETEARRQLLLSKLERTRAAVLGKLGAMADALREGDADSLPRPPRTPRGAAAARPRGGRQ